MRRAAWAAFVAAMTLATGALAQSNPRYIAFQPSATKGALYTPDSGPTSHVAFLTIHRTSNFMNMIGTRELARRGFITLGMNPRSDKTRPSSTSRMSRSTSGRASNCCANSRASRRSSSSAFPAAGRDLLLSGGRGEGRRFLPRPQQADAMPRKLQGSAKGRRPVSAGRASRNTINALRSLNPSVWTRTIPLRSTLRSIRSIRRTGSTRMAIRSIRRNSWIAISPRRPHG